MKSARYLAGIAALATIVTAGGVLAAGQGQGKGMRGMHDMRPSFAELDIDGDGEITMMELESQREARFSKADANGDGTLTVEEMQAQARMRADKRAAAMLERMDSNGDGVLSMDEMPKPKRAGRMFEHLDTDESGGISEQEFTEARAHMKAQGKKWRGMKGQRGMGRKMNCQDDES